MKLFLILLLPVFAFGQDSLVSPTFPIVNNKITYTAVVPIDSVITPDIQRTRAKLFLNKRATSHNAEVKMDGSKLRDYIVTDNENEVVGNVRFISSRGLSETMFEAVMTVEFKPGRFRYTLTDVKVIGTNVALVGRSDQSYPLEGNEWVKKKGSKLMMSYDTRMKDVVKDLIDIMKAPVKTDF